MFHCPSDPRAGALSYSINEYLGGNWLSYPRFATRLTGLGDTSQIFVLIEEIDLKQKRHDNDGGFVVEPYPSVFWTDYPAVVHGHGTCMTFLDGHAEYWQWSDSRTWNLHEHSQPTPGNPDLAHLQGVEGLGLGTPP